jgi:protein-disulfide isomerase
MKKEAKKSDMKFWLVSAAIVIILFAISISLNFFFPPPEKFEFPAKDFSKLNPDAVVQVDEFSDFTCPNSRTSAGVAGQLREYYGERINFTYKHFLITGEEPAVMAAQASECARDQGKFWEYHDILYSNFG